VFIVAGQSGTLPIGLCPLVPSLPVTPTHGPLQDSYGSVPMTAQGVLSTPTTIQGNAASASNALKVFSYIPTMARWVNLEFDMSFLSASTRLTSAQLWMFISSVGNPQGTTAQLTRVTLEAYDNSAPAPKSGVPCVPPIKTCTPVKVRRSWLGRVRVLAVTALSR
jgi:hypothetical protein